MSSRQVFQLRPSGWEHDPEEERFKLSIIDPTLNCAYNHYALFFRLEDSEKSRAVDILKAGLERTLSQARYLCGTIEKDVEGGYSFVKRKESTVQFIVHRLDPHSNHPSLDDIEQSYFSGHSLQDVNLWTCRELLRNCKLKQFPPWNPANIDVSRFTKNLPADSLVEGPPIAQKHPDHKEQQAVLFHLPKSKAAELKKLAMPAASEAPWISTYDAMCAYVWRMLSKIRAPVHKPDLSARLWWGEAVNMRPRLHNPPVPDRMMRNIVAGAFSDTAPVPPLTAGDVISDAPLSKLAGYIRALTESCTEQHVEGLIEFIAPIRDKRTISLRVDAHPPMSMFVTDHRSADVSSFDFGFARPITYRHLWGDLLTAGVVLIYAPIQSSQNSDEGFMFAITMEKDLVPKLMETPEWTNYFEYRGVD